MGTGAGRQEWEWEQEHDWTALQAGAGLSRSEAETRVFFGALEAYGCKPEGCTDPSGEPLRLDESGCAQAGGAWSRSVPYAVALRARQADERFAADLCRVESQASASKADGSAASSRWMALATTNELSLHE